MKSTTKVRRVVLTIIGVLFAVAVAAGGIRVEAAQSSPDFAIAISPTSQSVQRGAVASYTVTVTSLNGFNGVSNPVGLTTSGGPSGTVLGDGTLSPTAGAPATTTLKVTTSSSTSLGTHTITVSGVSGKLKHSATTGLTVNPIAPTPSFTLALTPASLSVDAGLSGVYNVALTRVSFNDPLDLTVSGLPDYVAFAFDPPGLTGTASSATLTITVDPSAKARSSDITITGTGGGLLGSTQGTLVVAKPQGKPFTISGNVEGLAPGVSQPIDLRLFNTNKGFISVTNLTVSLTSTSKSSCPTSNFEVKQYTGAYPIAVPPNDSILLSEVPIESQYRPAITMLNTPYNQDNCKGVSLSLSYSGSAQGN